MTVGLGVLAPVAPGPSRWGRPLSRPTTAPRLVRSLAKTPSVVSDEELTEDSPPGDDFMAHICTEWEKAARAAEPQGIRVAMVRIGIVLDKEGGALAKLLTPFRFGAGGPIGWTPWSGQQVMSWIHHADMVGLLLLALDHAKEYIYPEKRITAVATETSREISELIFNRHEPAKGQSWFIVEDVSRRK